MALSLQLGYPDVPRSITNPNVDKKNAIDVGYPMSFLDFIKNINISLEPETLQLYYNFYITTWNSKSKDRGFSERYLIIERYRNFLKDIIINYSTLEEKKYLSSIDFNDPHDLDIVLGFYSKKLKELCEFYSNKRNDAKCGILRKKMEGSVFGIGQTIKELTISYIKNIEDSSMLFDMDGILSNLEIEIEELYDTYPFYFNQIPNEKVYDAKDLDYGLNIFLKSNEELISEIFSELPDEILKLKEIDSLLDNKRKLTKKYMATDFYYLSTGPTTSNILSGKLFDNENTILNFLNRNYPTTTSTQMSSFQSERERGFFKPSNVSFVLIDGGSKDISVDSDLLEPNSLYFFPDPNVIGNDLGVIRFTIDDKFLKRNTTSGNAINQPSSDPKDTKYYGYYSKIDPNQKKYFDCVFNSGYVEDYKQDIYGNSYGLFKFGFEKYIKNLDAVGITTYNIIFNGHLFYDYFYDEGFGFDYTVVDDITYNETIRTGLSTNTLDFTVFDPDIKLSFGKFRPFYPLIPPTDTVLTKNYRVIDGALLTKSDSSPLADPISSDLSSFEVDPGPFYYTELIEGGISDDSPQTRALLDPLYPSLTAQFLNYDRFSTSSINGGRFEDIFGYTTITNNSIYIDSNINHTELLPQSTFNGFDGVLFVKNNQTKQAFPLLDTLPHLITSFPTTVSAQLSNIINFELTYDIISVETENYLLFDKITFENNEFIDSKQSPIYIEHSVSPFDNISNRLKLDNFIYYCVLKSEGSFFNDTLHVYPEIYRYNIKTNKNILLYPQDIPIPSYFKIYGDVEYIHSDNPILAYSSRNNIFNISFILKDQNNYPLLKSYDFKLSPNVEFISGKNIPFSTISISNIFYNQIPTTLNVYLSATETTNIDDVLSI